MARGKFITFEGGDGAGKSTQAAHLSERLKQKGFKTKITREPGGSVGAEQIRGLLVTGKLARWDAVSEALLFFAARRNHVETLIKPALKAGSWVISDRFSDSTMAYQGIAGGLGKETIRGLQKISIGDFQPDLTIVLDLPVAEGLKRSGDRNFGDNTPEDRFERKGEGFHADLRKAFLEVAKDNPDRCVVVDAGGGVDEVAKRVWQTVEKRLLK